MEFLYPTITVTCKTQTMERNADAILHESLSQCFLQALSPLPQPRRLAEAKLSDAASRPKFGLSLLRLIADPSIVDDQIRQSAAVYLKNHIRLRWSPTQVQTITPIPASDKHQIKAQIVPLMLSSSSPKIQTQLSEVISVIGKHDFPRLWPTLLPELVSNLREASDYSVINGVLGTVNLIFKKFRYNYHLCIDLEYCLDNFAAPLLEIFLKNATLIHSIASSDVTLPALMESQRLCCRIFFSLNCRNLQNFFEDHMKEWMCEFWEFLINTYPALEEEGDGAAQVAVVDELWTAVCENIGLYLEKSEGEFQDFLKDFLFEVCRLFGKVSVSSSRDRLAIRAIKLLTTASKSVHHPFFAGEGVISQICEGIVIPNVLLRGEDEEVFKVNYVEFIRRDTEGSDIDTRRSLVCELVNGIATNYKYQITAAVCVQIQKLLASYVANPSANWKDKDCAIYLVVSLATNKAGVSSILTDFVDIQSFFVLVIVPELQSREVNAFPMLKASALKFFTIFANEISKPVAVALVPEVVRFLGASSNVVHSYAASCIENLLLVKDKEGRARYTSADINPFVQMLMENLFIALKSSGSEENSYMMKCIMRVLGVADISHNIADDSIITLTNFLGEVCEKPKSSIFNHYLFESLTVLVRRACEHDSSFISVIEERLFTSIEMILENNVTEFFRYAFHLLAQLVELNRPPIPSSYMRIFQILLSPDPWKKAANVPALLCLLRAFVQKEPHELNREETLGKVLGIFKWLVSSPNTAEQGFYVLNTVIENLGYDIIAPYIGNIWNALFWQLKDCRTVKFKKSLLISMSLFLIKHGSANLVESMNSVQPNIFLMVLEKFWIPNLKLITGGIELKLTSVASINLICESPVLLDAAAVNLWGKMLDSILTLISRPELDIVEEEPECPDIGETVGYTTAFVQLYNIGKKDDPLKDIKDSKEYVISSLASISGRFPGRFYQIISEQLDPVNQAAYLKLCRTYKYF